MAERTGILPSKSPVRRTLRLLGHMAGMTLAAAGVAALAFATVPFLRAAARPQPVPVPSTMEAVDWHNPESSVYCLACHRDVAPAMAGRDVQQGHPQNVTLNASQLAALEDLGTVAGPDNTLICMSCHRLGEQNYPHMLADTLADGQFCGHCHPGQYAKDTPHDLRASAPLERNRAGQTVLEGGPCSACHLSHRYARDFVSTPVDPRGRCLTCHQQYRVAGEHARRTMEHPESRCSECHDPHDTTHGEFLKKQATLLCLECHRGYGDGLAAGMHPLVRLDRPIPTMLAEAGALAGEDPDVVTCITCHVVHEAGHDKLLVLEHRSNRLCLACHEDKLLAHAGQALLPRHGQSPPLNPAQQAVVAAWGGATSPAGELLCISCHRVHGGQPQTELLAFQPQYGETCTACHPDEASVVGTRHDLRTNFPQANNRAGLTPLAAGVCSPCHMAHQFPRDRIPSAGDPAGQCQACHLAGRIAQSRVASDIDHPDTACTDCHNPHARQHGRFLARSEPDLCGSCHPDQLRLLGGPHDLAQATQPERWNESARATGGLCLPCHVPHGGDRPDLFRIGAGQAVANHDDVCLACHSQAAWGAGSQAAAIHPQQISPDQKKVELELVPHDQAGNLRMGCRTCHDPHGGADPPYLARVGPDEPTYSVCTHCHVDKALMRFTGHAPEKFRQHQFDIDSCKPCHAMHAQREDSWGQMLSPRFLVERCAARENLVTSCVPCLACHNPEGAAPVRQVDTHPEVLMLQTCEPQEPGYLPLFDLAGHEDPQGQVTCRTCHVSHGRLDLLRRMAETPELTPDERDALRAQVRPFIAPNVCTACHGPLARELFLKFHDADWRQQMRRRGPLPASAGGPGG